MYTKEQEEIALKEYERLGSIAAVSIGWDIPASRRCTAGMNARKPGWRTDMAK